MSDPGRHSPGTNSSTMQTSRIHPDLRVNEVISINPATLPTFQRWGIDACCGGAHTLNEVAVRHGLDLERLLEELNEVNA
jgi:iron-sulfur cluster repair protein YtfE (RIC family)